MRVLVTVSLAIILTVISVQVYNLFKRQITLKNEASKIMEQTSKLEKENLNLQADLKYFADPLNLAKELKSKFNYKRPGEKLIIVVP